MSTDNHNLNQPDEGTLNWNEPINDNFGILDALIPMQGPMADRPTADGSQPPFMVVSPSADRGIYCDVDGSWVQVAAP